MVEPSSTDDLQYGSINDITKRLLLWGKRPGMGLTRVEFSSEFARQVVLQQLQTELAQIKVPFKDIVLPTYQKPAVLADLLEQALDECESGLVSISGLTTAFSPDVPLAEAMYSLNIRRERLAQRPLRQIWWMTPVFFETALHAMPDLMSWFSLRLELTESVQVESGFQPISESTVNIDDARKRSLHLIQRFEQALQAGGDDEELLKLYLLPALEALAEVGAQKDLRDLTSQFEGYLSNVRATDSSELASSLSRLGNLYRKQGRYLEAEPILQKALTLRQHLLGKEHISVANSFNILGTLYMNQGRYREAEDFYQEALEMRQRLLGKDNISVSQSLNNFAILYVKQGRYREAEDFYQKVLEMRQRLLGKDNILVANSLNNLAVLYNKQGRHREAEDFYRKALEIRQRLLGKDNILVADSLNNLATLYRSQGRYAESENLHHKALEMRQRLLGQNHPQVAGSLNNLAILYENQKRYVESESLHQKALEMYQKLVGEDHPAVANSLNGLAELYITQRRYEEAEKLCHQALKKRRCLFEKDHPLVKESLLTLERLNQEKEKGDRA
jgi:tetratricopeptide (TPR) repeat protein